MKSPWQTGNDIKYLSIKGYDIGRMKFPVVFVCLSCVEVVYLFIVLLLFLSFSAEQEIFMWS